MELAAWGFSFSAESKSTGEATGVESAFLKGNRNLEALDLAMLHNLLQERFESVDIAAAATEVRPFLRDPRELTLWSKDFFLSLVERVEIP